MGMVSLLPESVMLHVDFWAVLLEVRTSGNPYTGNDV